MREIPEGYRMYYGDRNRERLVKILSRSERLRCNHDWHTRVGYNKGKWGIVCSRCGGCCRGGW